MFSTAHSRHLVRACRLDREWDELQRARTKTFRVYKNVEGRLLFCDEIAAETAPQAIELCIRGVHGGKRFQYRAEEEKK